MVEFGWLDFSINDRNRTLDILNNLKEPSAIDELGIGYIRDAFSNIFFPGISTLHTRAKYFLVVPYMIQDILNKCDSKTNIKDVLKELNKKEKEFAENIYNANNDENGLIGKNSIKNNKWVKNPPSYMYWSGIKSFKIIETDLSLRDYIEDILDTYKQNQSSNYKEEEHGMGDDNEHKKIIIDRYQKELEKNNNRNSLSLTKNEAKYLKNKIIDAFPDSLMAYVLEDEKNMQDFRKAEDFYNLKVPNNLKNAYDYAISFADFAYVLFVVYNLAVTNGENKEVQKQYNEIQNEMSEIATNINFDNMYNLLKCNIPDFLNNAKKYMKENNIEDLKELICERECSLKRERAKCKNKEKNNEKWYGMSELNYRFYKAKIIVNDIYNGLGGK